MDDGTTSCDLAAHLCADDETQSQAADVGAVFRHVCVNVCAPGRRASGASWPGLERHAPRTLPHGVAHGEDCGERYPPCSKRSNHARRHNPQKEKEKLEEEEEEEREDEENEKDEGRGGW